MTPAPAMQWEAIRRPAVKAIWAIGIIGGIVGALALLRRLRVRLAAGNERGQSLDILFACRLEVLLRAGLMLRLHVLRLRVLLRLHVLRLNVRLLLLLAREVGLRFTRRERFAAERGLIAVAIVIAVVGNIAARFAARLVVGLGLAKLLLRGGDQAEIVLGVLIIILRRDRVSGALRISGKLEIFFGDVGCRAPNLHVRSIGLVHARQRILMMTTFAVATPHSLVLSVSHGLLFRQPPILRRHGYRRFTLLKSLTEFHPT
jgi:hypothetical protein